jgi:hypothetical protein
MGSCGPAVAMLGRLLFFSLIVGVEAVRDRWRILPDNALVHVHDTPNSTVNVTLADFQDSANANREAYNSIFKLLRVNETRSAVNILLKGLADQTDDKLKTSGQDQDRDNRTSGSIPDLRTGIPDTWTEFLTGTYSFLFLLAYRYLTRHFAASEPLILCFTFADQIREFSRR